MGEVIHRVDAPGIARALVACLADAIERRIAQVDIRRCHVDLRPQHVRAVGELAAAHALEEVEVLGDAALPVGAVAPGRGERPAIRPDLVGGEAVHVRLAVADELHRAIVDLPEIVGGVGEPVAPFVAEPVHPLDDRVHELLVLLYRIRVVEAQVALAAVLLGDPEIEADGFRVADVQIPVRLGRETRDDPPAVPAVGDVVGNDLADEVPAAGFSSLGHESGHASATNAIVPELRRSSRRRSSAAPSSMPAARSASAWKPPTSSEPASGGPPRRGGPFSSARSLRLVTKSPRNPCI